MRAKRNIEISNYITLSLNVICALLMRSYINRSFFYNTLKAIQLNILFHILIYIFKKIERRINKINRASNNYNEFSVE